MASPIGSPLVAAEDINNPFIAASECNLSGSLP